MIFLFSSEKIITRYRRTGYNLNVMRQSACLVFNPIMVDGYAAFFNFTPVGRASDSMMAPTLSYSFKLVLSVAWPTGVQLLFSFCSGVSKLFGAQDLHRCSLLNLLSPRFLFIRMLIVIYLLVLYDSLTS